MLKKKLKMIVLITVVLFATMFSFNQCFATDASSDVSTNEIITNAVTEDATTQGDIMPISEDTNQAPISTTDETSDETSEEADAAEPEIYSDDLYLAGSDVVMDKLVDGNVYIIANTVEITGQVSGNLYVFANNINFSGAQIRYSVYAFGQTVKFDGACNDLYIASNNINVTYDSYIVRDVHAIASSIDFFGAVGRNVNVISNSLNLEEKTENEESETEPRRALIYGKLDYKAPNEITVPDGVVEGEIIYNKLLVNNTNSNGNVVLNYVISLAQCIIYTFVVFFLMLWLTPKFVEKSKEFVSAKMAIGLAIGIVSVIVSIFVTLLLTFLRISAPVAILLMTAYILLASIGFATISICLANKFAKHAKLGKKLALLLLVTIILWALTQIPYAGGIIWLVLTLTGLGILLFYSFTKNKKDKNIEE